MLNQVKEEEGFLKSYMGKFQVFSICMDDFKQIGGKLFILEKIASAVLLKDELLDYQVMPTE